MSTILVTGGTGMLGRPVCDALRGDGHEVRVLSRHSPPYAVDLRESGRLVDRAVDGADAVVHCTNILRGDAKAATNLIDAARRAGVPHLVYISIVGVDRMPYAHLKAKYVVERLIERSGLGWTVLRATQFHELLFKLLEGLARPPVMVLPKGLAFQPLEATEAAARLAELATGPPVGRAEDMGGPEILALAEMARAYLAAARKQRRIVETPLPGRLYRGFRHGAQLAPEFPVGRVTFEEFLTGRFGG
ncbi:NAD(P)H-binding protein [Streptomyces sp. HUAS MG47]|uniref:SDR family oxidoreductase n=1 Tax=Streptomyces solicamelliae TaxID=3231716 RepID=UPI0038779188